MSKAEMLNSEVLEELLRERVTFPTFESKSAKYWLLLESSFLNSLNLNPIIEKSQFFRRLNSNNMLKSGYSVLLTTNKVFFVWLKLRLGYFEEIDDLKNLQFSSESYIMSNGISGSFTYSDSNSFIKSPLETNLSYI
jgi:hypothetical protein